MADNGERQMLFDLRGRRKRVIQVVYVILAVLMAASLLLVVGPINLGDVVGGGATGDAAESLEDRADAIERKVRNNPQDDQLLLALVRAQLNAGNARVDIDPATGEQTVTGDARRHYRAAAESWDRYMRRSDEPPTPSVAQLAASAFYTLAASATSTEDADAALRNAVEAQKIVARARPSLGSHSSLAIYSYFALDFPGGDRAAERALAEATSKGQRRSIDKQLSRIRKQAKRYQKQRREFAKFERQQGRQQLENPLGGFSGGGTGIPATPGAP